MSRMPTERRRKNEKRNNTQPEEENTEYIMREKTDMKKIPLKIIQWNADAFLSKKEEFRGILKDKNVDIFMIQETK